MVVVTATPATSRDAVWEELRSSTIDRPRKRETMEVSRLSRFLWMGAALLAAGVVLAACTTDTDTAGSSTSTQPDPETALVVATTTTQPGPTTTIDAQTKVTVVEGVPYRQPNDGDPSTVDVYPAASSAD